MVDEKAEGAVVRQVDRLGGGVAHQSTFSVGTIGDWRTLDLQHAPCKQVAAKGMEGDRNVSP
jgi:hypothetical protein